MKLRNALMALWAFGIAVWPSAASAGAATSVPSPQCVLSYAHPQFTGSCRVQDNLARFALSKRALPDGSVLRPGATPKAVWGGFMADQDYDRWPLQLQIYNRGTGVLQTAF